MRQVWVPRQETPAARQASQVQVYRCDHAAVVLAALRPGPLAALFARAALRSAIPALAQPARRRPGGGC
eukprot:8310008-Lingulodinium_polyedra.AAC.1